MQHGIIVYFTQFSKMMKTLKLDFINITRESGRNLWLVLHHEVLAVSNDCLLQATSSFQKKVKSTR